MTLMKTMRLVLTISALIPVFSNAYNIEFKNNTGYTLRFDPSRGDSNWQSDHNEVFTVAPHSSVTIDASYASSGNPNAEGIYYPSVEPSGFGNAAVCAAQHNQVCEAGVIYISLANGQVKNSQFTKWDSSRLSPGITLNIIPRFNADQDVDLEYDFN